MRPMLLVTLAIGWCLVASALCMGRPPQARETIMDPNWKMPFWFLSLDGRVAAIQRLKSSSQATEELELWTLDEHRFLGVVPLSATLGFAVSTDCQQAAFVGADGKVTIWNVSTGEKTGITHPTEKTGITHPQKESPEAIAFSGDGRRLLVCSTLSIEEWDIPACRRLTQVKTAAQNWLSVWYTPDGKARGASYLVPRTVIHWDLEHGIEIGRIQPTSPGSIKAVTVSADGRLLAMAVRDSVIEIWDLESASMLEQYPVPRFPARLAFSPGSAELAVSHAHQHALVGPASQLSTDLGDFVSRHARPVTGTAVIDRTRGTVSTGAAFSLNMAITSDGKTRATTNDDGVQLWDLPLKQRLAAWWVWLTFVALSVLTGWLLRSLHRGRVLARIEA